MVSTRTLSARNGTRRMGWGAALWTMLTLALVLVAACGEAAPDAHTLLKNAQTQLDATKSFHFVLTTSHPGTGTLENPIVTDAKGDVVRPDELSTDATVSVGLATLPLKVIVAGGKQWYTDPLTGKVVETTQFTSYARIFDPQVGLGSLLTKLNNPSAPTDSSANGTPCWKVTGSLKQSDLTPVFGGAVQGDANNVSVCIGKSDNRVYSVTIPGAILAGDTSQTSRTFVLSNFDQSVTISTPAVGQ